MCSMPNTGFYLVSYKNFKILIIKYNLTISLRIFQDARVNTKQKLCNLFHNHNEFIFHISLSYRYTLS